MADDASVTQFPVPFGKYLLTELIAVGGMAEVYKGKIFGASGFEKEMVVKRILPRYAQNPSFVQMLIDEAKIAVNLTHGNIVPIYELGEFEGSYYIAMEYVEGQTILDVLRVAHGQRKKLAWPFALGICADVAAGLDYAHSRRRRDGSPLGLVHRDINPRNIVITRDGEVKILDFGIARASTKKHQTASGVIKGTPGYMSPEQMRGQAVDARSDIYCLGILAHELLTLRRLFPAWTVKEMRQLFEEKVVPRPTEMAPEVPEEASDVVMRALAVNPTERYQEAGELEEALRGAIAKSGTAVTARGLAREIQALTTTPDLSSGFGAVARSPGPDAPTTSERTRLAGATHDQAIPSSPLPPTTPLPVRSSGRGHPGTQPMPPQASAHPNADDEHAFVISLASDPGVSQRRGPPSQLEPLPQSRAVPSSEEAPRTQVLAQNDALAWSAQIGDDAELLAIAKGMGVAPGQTRNRLLIAAGVAFVVLVPAVFFYAPDIADLVDRAIEGRQVRPGAVVIKTRPSGAQVILDGEERGKTNIRIAGIDADASHQLVVVPDGMDPIQIEFTPDDFKPVEGMPTYVFERDFVGEAAPEDEGVEEGKKAKRKRGRRRR